MVVLLLDRERRVALDEARHIIQAEHGKDAAETIQEHPGRDKRYFRWKLGETPYNMGTFNGPYINAVGQGKVNNDTGKIGEVKWTMWEEVPPEGEAECTAWMSHTAWMYVDALLFFSSSPEEDEVHRQHVLRIASQLVDHRCVLLWLWGPSDQPKRVALPTPDAIAMLRSGSWTSPETTI